MINFEWPMMLLFLPLPLLVRFFSGATTSRREAALRVPFLEEFSPQTGIHTNVISIAWKTVLATLAWVLLILAAMKPLWIGEFIEMPVTGRDMLLVVDLSGSMQEQDFLINGQSVDRLTALKYVAGEFIERRVGDRLGLILFGDRAYMQAPLTLDRETVKTLLYEAVIGLAGRATAIGDAIGLSVKRLREQKNSNKILILLTDGANSAGEVDPVEAAKLAAKEGIKIYTIGIGADEMIVESFFGSQKVNPSAELDEKALTGIAGLTGGKYFRARDTEELDKIYAMLDELEPIEQDVKRFRPMKSLYYWPLALSVILAAGLLLYQFSWHQLSRRVA